MLIALEFVRGAKIISGFKAIQAFIGMLFALPFRPYLNAIGTQKKSMKNIAIKTPLLIVLILYAIVFAIINIPLTLGFYLFYIIIAPLEFIHFGINKFYLKLQQDYGGTYGFFARATIKSSERYKNISAKQVIKEIQKKEIPILPIIGVVLITIAFIMYLL